MVNYLKVERPTFAEIVGWATCCFKRCKRNFINLLFENSGGWHPLKSLSGPLVDSRDVPGYFIGQLFKIERPAFAEIVECATGGFEWYERNFINQLFKDSEGWHPPKLLSGPPVDSIDVHGYFIGQLFKN